MDGSGLKVIQGGKTPTLTIHIDGPYLPYDKFKAILEDFSVILKELDKEISGKDTPSVEWAITSVSGGSIHLTIEGNPVDEETDPDMPLEVITTFEKGIESLRLGDLYPEGFSSRALKSTKNFATAISPDKLAEISFSSNDWRFDVSPSMSASVDELVNDFYKYHGSIEGRLVSISVVKNINFCIRTTAQKKLIKCSFKREMLEEAKQYIDKRVYVYGLIRQIYHGDKLSVQVETIRPLPMDEEVRSTQDLLRDLRRG
ncbi:hypothetical protein Pse7367_1770 [Thalassoporum mexicanum PCC 7367]|uniref:hypothetical protein n=1 Tax=Thalassoporum mexicanum TaxID=3457544 RepID=UPI00029F84A1|nr:hypothetical protein [Pseudanabaena sp. PCC 7367]AFY70048.1 hypothetical protein Pse7367_1770 [Pseudanabaena sp. PCC 7367]